MKILITSANSAEAYQLKNKLEADTVILGDYMDLPEFMLKTGKMLQLPDPKTGSFAHQILTLSLDNGIEAIYPLREEEKELLKEAEQLFNEFNIEIK